jgi:hypothetical protein
MPCAVGLRACVRVCVRACLQWRVSCRAARFEMEMAKAGDEDQGRQETK